MRGEVGYAMRLPSQKVLDERRLPATTHGVQPKTMNQRPAVFAVRQQKVLELAIEIETVESLRVVEARAVHLDPVFRVLPVSGSRAVPAEEEEVAFRVTVPGCQELASRRPHLRGSDLAPSDPVKILRLASRSLGPWQQLEQVRQDSPIPQGRRWAIDLERRTQPNPLVENRDRSQPPVGAQRLRPLPQR